MNDEARAELDRILALEPAALSDADKAFLAARRDYLTEEQKAVYGLLDDASADESDEQPRARKGRKASDSEQSEA